MSHGRKIIRHAIRDMLLLRTSAGPRVYTNRRTSLWENELPAIVIFTSSQEDEVFNEAPREYERQAQISIELIVAKEGEIPLDDEMDDLGEQVEQILFNNPMLLKNIGDKSGPVAKALRSLRTETQTDYEGQMPIGGIRLNFEAIYYQMATEGDTCLLDEFKSTGIDWDLAPPDLSIEARDIVSANP